MAAPSAHEAPVPSPGRPRPARSTPFFREQNAVRSVTTGVTCSEQSVRLSAALGNANRSLHCRLASHFTSRSAHGPSGQAEQPASPEQGGDEPRPTPSRFRQAGKLIPKLLWVENVRQGPGAGRALLRRRSLGRRPGRGHVRSPARPPTEPLTESQWGPGPHLQAPGLSSTFSNYRIIFISNYRKISHDFKTALKEKKVSFLAV